MDALGTRIERTQECGVGRLDVRLLGFACLVASDLMLLNGFRPDATLPPSSSVPADGANYHVYVLMSFLLASLAGAVACLLWDRLRTVSIRRSCRPDGPDRPILAASAVLFAIGMGANLLRDPLGSQTLGYAVLTGAPLGLSNALLIALWGDTYAALPPRRCLFHASLSCAAGIALSVLGLMLLGNTCQEVVWTACQVAGYAALGLLGRDAKTRGETTADSPAAAGEPGVVEPAPAPAARREAGGYLWIALAGTAIFLFVLGVYWRTYAFAVFFNPYLETGVSWAVAAALCLLAAQGRGIAGFDGVYRVSIIVASAILLADPFLSLMGIGDMFVVSGVSWTFCLMVFSAVAWSACAVVAHVGSAAPRTAFGAYRAVWSAALAAGIAVGGFVEAHDLKMVLTALIVAFLVAVFIDQVWLSRRPTDAEVAVPDESALFEERIGALAAEHGLSERELEVFRYLVQGRGETFIAGALSISPNTVKAHRKHIYKKFGVSSREELLDRVAVRAPR